MTETTLDFAFISNIVSWLALGLSIYAMKILKSKNVPKQQFNQPPPQQYNQYQQPPMMF